MRLGWKLTLAFLIVGLTGVGVIALFASRTTKNEFGQFIFTQYRDTMIEQTAQYYRDHNGWLGIESIFPFPPKIPLDRTRNIERGGAAITLIDQQGMVIFAGRGYEYGELIPPGLLEKARPIEVDGQVVGWLFEIREAFRENPAEALFIERINRFLTVGAIGALIGSLVLGIFLARTLTRPIREMTAASHAIADGNLEQQVSVRSKDELGELAASFNTMSAKLARSQTLRRQMTADIAHELRTPISLIIGHIDAMDEGVLPASSETFNILRDEALRLGRLIEDLRTLSRADAGELILVRRFIQPVTLLEQASRLHQPLALGKGLTIQLQADSDLPEINVDPDRMAQVLDNLMSNALRYTPVDGQITLQARKNVDSIELQIQDSGPGIDAEDVPYVFDRFYRTDKSRQRETGGSGLGLAIAKSIIELHGGQSLVESKPGEGTSFIIRLPITDGS